MAHSIVDVLRSAYFFSGLSDSVVDAIAEQCRMLDVVDGTVIFSEGERGDRLFIVLSGEVQIWKNYGAVDASQLAVHAQGRFFGEIALVDHLPRSATAVATAPSSLVYLSRESFLGLVNRYPDLAMTVMRSLSAIVRDSNDSFVADLNHRNRELERAYADLARAQRELLSNERLSNLGKMSDMILHDIRNPISVLRGYAQLLATYADKPDRVREVAGRISRETERLSHLAGELLDYSRGEVRLDMSVVNPSKVADAVREYMTDRLSGSGVALEINVGSDEAIVCDFQRIVRALLNIVDNARKACHAGGRVLFSFSREDDVARFRVEDNGEGMEPEVTARVLEPFFSHSGRGGTGIGMVIVNSIVSAHGGHLEFDSELGRGTVCTITMPAGVRRDSAQ